jgi:hypothetical protein
MKGFFLKCATLAAGVLLFTNGCAFIRSSADKTPDRTKLEYDSFQQISVSCLELLKGYVSREYRVEYLYKNSIKSREPGYLEAVFVTMSGAPGDSVVIVKYDSLCAIKRSYKTKMIVSEEYR